MADEPERRGGRGRSDVKRLAILVAAESLFLEGGYDRTSADGIAARAGVSKRTVYDHFGDKERLHASVVDRVTSELLGAVERALREELPDGCDPATSLLSFARRIATETLASSEYARWRSLAAGAGSAGSTSTTADPDTLLQERIAAFVRVGALNAPDAHRATQHFVALTFLVALDAQERGAGTDELDAILVDGVSAFMRAYGR